MIETEAPHRNPVRRFVEIGTSVSRRATSTSVMHCGPRSVQDRGPRKCDSFSQL